MSDNKNQPPGSDPADDQPDRPQEPVPGQPPAGQGAGSGGWFGSRDNEAGPRGPGEQSPGEGQPATWWTGDSDAKREFSNPAQSDQPASSWFDGGWDPNRREHPDQPAPGHPGRPQPGPNQPGPGRPGPNQPGPAQRGPAQSRPNQPGPNQPGSWQPGPPAPQPRATAPSPWQSGPQGPQQPGPQQPGPQQPGPQQPGPLGLRPSGPQGPQAGQNPQTGANPSGPPQANQSQPNAPQWGTQSWTLQTGADQGGSQTHSPQSGPGSSGGWSATGKSESSAWQASPSQQQPPQQQTGPRSESSYLWGTQGQQQGQQQSSPWSNALPPQQPQTSARHAAPQGGQGQIGPMGQPVQQAPTWQYPPIPIPQPPGGRRRRKKKMSRALLIGLVVLAVLVVGSGVTLLIRGLGGDSPEAKTTPTTSTSESPSPSESPSTSPSPSTPRGPTVDEVVKGSRLYTIGPLAASKCAEPPFAPVTVAAAQQYYNRLLPCLNRTWWLAMKKATLPFRNPKAVVYVGKVPSPCGMQRSVRAAYCGANETIYLPFSVDNRSYTTKPPYARAIMLNTFAHEYGHHVQKLSGILAASMSRQQSMTPNQKLTESRRRELQATCLGAVYLGANATYIPMNGVLLNNWKFLISHSGDDYARPRVHDHGNRVSNYQWSITGYNNKKPDSCNTFTAADVRVN